jgi:hypothetical protein
LWSEKLKGRDHLEDLGVDGKNNIGSDTREMGWDGVNLIHLAWERD